MNELISLSQSQIGNETIETVNARDLHKILDSRQDFSTWIKARFVQCRLKKDVDYLVHKTMEQLPSGAKTKIDYFISIHMAEHIALMERTDVGFKVRDYFIACRDKLKSVATTDFLENPAKLRAILLDNVEKVMALEADNAEMKPKVAAYEHLTRSDGSFCITDAGKALGMRPKDTFLWLNAIKWIYRRAGNAHWVGYQDKIQNGFLDHKVSEVTRSDGSTKITEQVRVTAKGMARLAELYEKAAA